jgi:hypothetical protein
MKQEYRANDQVNLVCIVFCFSYCFFSELSIEPFVLGIYHILFN